MPASGRPLRVTKNAEAEADRGLVPRRRSDRSQLIKFVMLRVLGDFFVIVAGVMVALAGDAWRERRAEADQEHEYLHRIANDLQRSLRRFDFSRAALERTTNHGLAILMYLRDALPDTSFAAILGSAYYAARPALPTDNDDSYAELVTRSGLRLIRDDSLRSQIIAYYRRMDGGPLPGVVVSDNLSYRNVIRSIIPYEVQVTLRNHCMHSHKPLSCAASLDEDLSRRAVRTIRGDANVERALNLWLQSIEQESRRLDALERRTRLLLNAIQRKVHA